MGDPSINFDYDGNGKMIRIRKMIEMRELFFEYDPKKRKAVYKNTINHAGGRIHSADDTWVPKCRKDAALKQATAIFRQNETHENKPSQSLHQATFPFFKA